eukprot:GILJ01003812.1.p1 GENE.GILJ01003812.1~~GILJ01003812.1.p1  ORF type:complete len:531 (-),score=139.30 GILJ01003812.1:146-1708(-)
MEVVLGDPLRFDDDELSNPFCLPSDEEVFLLREQERKNRQENKEKQKTLKIWEKGTNTADAGRIRRFRDEILPTKTLPSRMTKNTKGLVAAATAAISRDHRREKENMTEFITKKREMFLVQMSLDTKREEIRKLEEKAQMKEEALKKSEQMLEEDMMRFDTFLKENDRRAHEAIRKAEAETKAKQEKVAKIKTLNQQIAAVQSEMSKHKEQLEECLKYKHFLDKLTPKEWIEQQAEAKRVRRERRKAEWLEKRKTEVDLDVQDDTSTRAAGKKKKTKLQELEEEYKDEDSEEELPMYFKHPHQLLDIFTQLEEQNLFLIQNSQETEQALEELKQSFEETKRKMDEKTRTLKDNIRDLEKQITEENRKALQLQDRLSKSTGVENQDEMLRDLDSQVAEVYQTCGFDSDANPGTIQMLANIEAKLEELLTAMDEMDPAYVAQAEKDKQKERRQRIRNERVESQKQQYEQRLKKSLLRSQAPVHKKSGKQLMFRSAPLEKKKKDTDNLKKKDDDEEDIRRFFS